MAWTIPATITAGQVLGATLWNEQVRDNIGVLKSPPFQQIVWNGSANATASTAVPISTASLSIALTTYGGDIHCVFRGYQGNGNSILYGLTWDNTGFNSGSAISRHSTEGTVGFDIWVTGLASGSHTFRPVWWQGAGLAMLLQGASANAVFWAREG